MTARDYLNQLESQVFFGGEQMVGSVRWYIKWYRDHAVWKRRWFRLWGLVALVVSVSLPFVLSFSADSAKPHIAAGGAWFIALAGGLNGFYQFNKTWQSYIETQYRLEHLLTTWELGRAQHADSAEPEAPSRLQEAARTFIEAARAAITDETKSYFEEVKYPNLNVKGG